MSLRIASLNSGSNGNAYYVGNHADAVLIDAGISCREIERRMKRIGLDMDSLRAVFISHEHSDHIRGVEALSNKYELPVYITEGTQASGNLNILGHLVRRFRASEPVKIGGLSVHPFSKFHDAADPHSFMVSYAGVNVGVLTDIGTVCEEVVRYFTQCHAAFLEANYDDQMLENGRYPWFLKNRIKGNYGHLSNSQAVELFTRFRPAQMRHLILSHLSKDNNHPELALEAFTRHAGNVQISVASRDAESCVLSVGEAPLPDRKFSSAVKATQLKLL